MGKKHTAVLLRRGKHASASAVVQPRDVAFVVHVNDQWRTQRVVPRPQLAVPLAVVHVCQPRPHFISGDHGHVLNPQRLKDVVLEKLVQFKPGGTLKGNPGPVDANLWGLFLCVSATFISSQGLRVKPPPPSDK